MATRRQGLTAGQEQGPRTTPLSPYVLEGVVDLNEVIGHGSYAVVKKLKFRGLECVGKKMHEVLYINATPQQRRDMLTRFEGECDLLSRLHHPYIVQFMGVCFEEGSPLPVLIMERLYSTLAAVIDCYGVLPDQISYGILCDVSLGLRYLHEHSPPIIHRDLSANNILLTRNTSAKISDLGVAKMLDLTPAQMTQLVQTKAPGTPCYMPPEALITRPKYNIKIDIYSIGVMMIHMFCGEWPFPTDVFQPDPRDPNSLVPMTEVERRADYLHKIGDDHPLTRLMHHCLSNNPNLRPSATKIHSQLAEVQDHLPAVPETRVEMFRQLQLSCDKAVAVRQSLTEQINALKLEKVYMQKSSSQKQPSQDRVQLLHPQAKLQWKRCTDMPVELTTPQAVAVGDEVFVGAGSQPDGSVFNYSIANDKWASLPNHCIRSFALCHFQGHLTTVGGEDGVTSEVSTKVYCLVDGKWVESLRPMPKAKAAASIFTTESALIVCGGIGIQDGSKEVLSTVEVYSSTTLQWYTADPLPQPCWGMSSVIISGCGYLMRGCNAQDTPINDVFQVDLTKLIDRATSHTEDPNTTSAWKTLPDTPLTASAAATLSGSLLAVGGIREDYDVNEVVSQVSVFTPFTNLWVTLPSGDLPVKVCFGTAVQLPENRVLLLGGMNNDRKELSTCFIGSLVV